MNGCTPVTPPANALARDYFVHDDTGLLVYVPLTLADIKSCRGALVLNNVVAPARPGYRFLLGRAYVEEIASRNPMTLNDVARFMLTKPNADGRLLITRIGKTASYTPVDLVEPSALDVTVLAVPHAMFSGCGESLGSDIISGDSTIKHVATRTLLRDPTAALAARSASFTAIIPSGETAESVATAVAATLADTDLPTTRVVAIRDDIVSWLATRGLAGMMLPTLLTICQTSRYPDDPLRYGYLDDYQQRGFVPDNATVSTVNLMTSINGAVSHPALTSEGRVEIPVNGSATPYVTYLPAVQSSYELTTSFIEYLTGQGGAGNLGSLLRKLPAEIVVGTQRFPLRQVFGHQPYKMFHGDPTMLSASVDAQALMVKDLTKRQITISSDDLVAPITASSLGTASSVVESNTPRGVTMNDTMAPTIRKLLGAIVTAIRSQDDTLVFDPVKANEAFDRSSN